MTHSGGLCTRRRTDEYPPIAALAAPKRILASRSSTFFERQVWEMKVVIERYRLQSNGEIALELYDIPSATYMNAYMPNPSCLSPTQTSDRSRILAARSAFTKACPAPTPHGRCLARPCSWPASASGTR